MTSARKRAGRVRLGFGADLLGPLHVEQAHGFRLRGAVEPAIDVLRSATSVNAALLNMEGRLGVIAPEAYADLVALDGDPLADLSAVYGRPPALVMRAGRLFTART